MVFILCFYRLMGYFNMHQTFSPFWQRVNVFFFVFSPSSGVFLYRIYNMLNQNGSWKIGVPLNFGHLRISDLMSSIFTLFTPPVMPCSSGLYIVERWRRARTRWRIINQMFDVESILEFFVVIKFRCIGSCIIERNTRCRLQLKILWNTRLGLGILLIFTASLPLLAL